MASETVVHFPMLEPAIRGMYLAKSIHWWNWLERPDLVRGL